MKNTNNSNIPKAGSRWMIRYGYDTFVVKILSSNNERVAWEEESRRSITLINVEKLEYFLTSSHRNAIQLPDRLPFWKRILNLI